MDKSLDFSPKKPLSPIFPFFTWQGKALNHFQTQSSGETPIIALDHLALDQALGQLYPQLCFAELACFYKLSNQHFRLSELQWQDLFQTYGYRYDQRLQQSIELFHLLPANLQNWMKEKECSPKDIAPLQSLETINHLSQCLKAMVELRPSRGQGVKVLEILVDLILLGHSDTSLLPKGKNLEEWTKELLQKRYPMTHASDQAFKQKLLNLPWPKSIQAQWQRQGDCGGLQIKFQISSAKDLANKINSLNGVAEKWAAKND